MSVRLLTGDCLSVMPTLGDGIADAIVTDPPYGLKFMGKAWDHGVPGVQFWRAALHTLKPGAYLLAFGGTRKFHRLACSIEDAGFELHDTLSWLYGSGFPKHRSKLKPGWEPIVLARRPAAKATELQIDACRLETNGEALRAGAGAIPMRNDERVPRTRRGEPSAERRYSDKGGTSFAATPGERGGDPRGRWPANVALDEEAAALLDEQSGVLVSGANPTRRGSDKFRNTYGEFEGQAECDPARGVDVGGASRFYYCAKASRTERNAGLEGREKKPLNWSSGTQSPGTFQSEGTDKSAENHHPTVKPVALMRWLCRLVTPPGGVVLDPFMGSGSTGIAARLEGFQFVGIDDTPEYVEIATARIAHHESEATNAA